jgi:hypothetical protein
MTAAAWHIVTGIVFLGLLWLTEWARKHNPDGGHK